MNFICTVFSAQFSWSGHTQLLDKEDIVPLDPGRDLFPDQEEKMLVEQQVDAFLDEEGYVLVEQESCPFLEPGTCSRVA